SLPIAPLKWVDSNSLLALVRHGKGEAEMCVVTFDMPAFREKAVPVLAVSEPRQPPLKLQMTPSPDKLIPPQTWTPPPTSDKPSPTKAGSISMQTIPQASGNDSGAVLKYVYHDKPRGRNEYLWERVDLTTGKALGDPIRLWPWIVPPD